MDRFLYALKKCNETSIPKDQAVEMLESLIALWGNENLLKSTRTSLATREGVIFKEANWKPNVILSWAIDTDGHTATFFLNWESLDYPFNITFWI